MDRVHERDYALIDTLNEHYTNFGETIDDAYGNWRKYSHEELAAAADAKRKALTRGLLGAAAVIGGVMAGQNTNSSAGSAAATAAVIGGIYAFKSGLDMRAEIKMHDESLKQLGSSFQNEVQPSVVDIEGRTLELKGRRSSSTRNGGVSCASCTRTRRACRRRRRKPRGQPPASAEPRPMTNRMARAGGQVVAARYELTRPLAAGHDGATWLARDTRPAVTSCCVSGRAMSGR